jgi:hypothetical protein
MSVRGTGGALYIVCLFRKKDVRMATVLMSELGNWKFVLQVQV